MRSYMAAGMNRKECLAIVGLTKHQYYYSQRGTKPGRQPTCTTTWRDPATGDEYEVDNLEVVDKIVTIKLDPDHSNWYRMIAVNLAIMGYYINHKKVYRLMQAYVLLEAPKKTKGRNFVQYRRVIPEGPLRILEMDIKYVWIHGANRHAKVLTIIDTFTRYALHWTIGYSMKSIQVKEAFEYVIAEYFQGADLLNLQVEIVLRNDNDKVFEAKLMQDFFKANHVTQEFTHPYTPEENGHIESFHSILSKSLKHDKFMDLDGLESRLTRFYQCYNNDRAHSATKGVPPAKFWMLHELEKVEMTIMDKRKVRFELKVAYQDILTIQDIDKYQYRRLGA